MAVKVSYKGFVLEFEKAPTAEQIKESYKKALEMQNAKEKTENSIITKDKNYNLSYAQKSLWLASQVEAESGLYVIPFVLRLKGNLNREALQYAINQVIKRHSTLRTIFEHKDGVLTQRVLPELEIKIPYTALELQGEEEKQAMVQKLIREQSQKRFLLDKGPLIRINLFSFAVGDYFAFISMHHIISDGHSVNIFTKDFAHYYTAFINKSGEEAEPLKMEYSDFIMGEHKKLQDKYLRDLEEYWMNCFSDETPIINMPKDKTVPPDSKYISRTKILKLDEKLTAQIREFSSKNGVSPFITLLSVFKTMLFRYTGQEDIIVGTPISTRNNKDTKNLIGCFINTLPLKTSFWGNPSFKEILQRVKHTTFGALEHQEYPFSKLVEAVNPERNVDITPIFQVMMSYQSSPFTSMELPELSLTSFDIADLTTVYDLFLEAVDNGGSIDIRFQYPIDQYFDETIERMMVHYKNILTTVLKTPSNFLDEIDMLSESERTTILNTFNDTYKKYEYKCIHQLFEEQCEKYGEHTALKQNDEVITYSQLNARANQLARLLRSKGIAQNHIVGILVEPSINMIIAMLGILKAGGAYLPIDPTFPSKRIEYLINDSKVKVLISQRQLVRELDFSEINFKGEIICIEEKEQYGSDVSNLENINEVKDLAYIIYTSGSTGKPKGVMLEHKSVHNFINGMSEQIDFSDTKTIMAITTISFDIFVLESLLPLTRGMRVVVADENQQKDPRQLCEAIIENKVDMLQLTPSRAQLLLSDKSSEKALAGIKELMLGGEALPEALLKKLKKLVKGRIYNMYGPTETTVWSSIKELTNEDSITIGKPILNTSIYILDDYGSLQPIGVPGEIHIAGDGLARGYYNRMDLTIDSFIPDPFNEDSLMYRTGDIGKWTEDGNIICYGRKDSQVKIKGYRIELEEIEKVLSSHKAVSRAKVVIIDDKSGGKQIAAYVILDLVYIRKEENSAFALSQLTEFLSQQLPIYMVPSHIVNLETFPETPNGKIDVKSLPYPSAENDKITSEYVEPKNEKQKMIAKIYEEVLKISSVGISDNFFILGGDSMKAVQVVALLNQENYDLKVKDIFKYPTIEKLEKHIVQIASLLDKDEIPITELQQSILEQLYREDFQLGIT